jgi:hypothetical protein
MLWSWTFSLSKLSANVNIRFLDMVPEPDPQPSGYGSGSGHGSRFLLIRIRDTGEKGCGTYVFINLLSWSMKWLGNLSSLDRSSSGCSAHRVGTGPLRPCMPSKTVVLMGQDCSTLTATLSACSTGAALTVAAGRGISCSCS